MANKQVDGLTAKSEILGDDLIPVYDSEEVGTEKVKKSTLSEFKMVKWNPFTGVGNKPGLVVLHGPVCPILAVDAPESDNHAVASAADFIISVIENGDPPYLYGLNKSGGAVSIIYSDPRDAVIVFDCTDFGAVPMEVWISDNTGNQGFVETYVIVQDPYGLCAAP